jgi:HAD superfamily hydrolase (TIGR01490 family)
MRERIDPIWLSQAESLIKQHRDFGRQVAVITATNRFIVEPIVQRFGVENLICSEPEILTGRYTGNFVGEPCFGEGKVIKIEEWLAANSLDLNSSWFYSDSHNDLPLLRKVTRPIAVDPDEKLKIAAQENGWQIISLR